ncbi:MAG: DUF2914 domain-containing protein, partial [Gammaproteobacteria bacterium]
MLKSIFLVMAGLILSGTALADELMPQTPEAPATEATTETTQTEEAAQAAPQAEATGEVAAEQSGFSRGSVMRSIFTNGIENREPIDNMKTSGNNSNKITYFTELRDMSGQKAIHRWEHNGEVMAEVEFNVRGPRWRVWSSKSFIPKWEGEWKVSVLNAAGDVISEEMINYKEPEMAA